MEQYALFESIAKNHMGENDAIIIATHEPRWILDTYEEDDKTEERLSYLIDHVFKGRVVLRLAGDIHNYTRHSLRPIRSTPPSPTVTSPPRSPMAAAKTAPASSPQRQQRMQRRRSSIQLLAPRALSPTRKHFPHMYADEADTSKQTEPSSTSISSPRQSITGNKPRGALHLIVSGGGGAFLHPTHAPRYRTLRYKSQPYKQQSCYPPVQVSRRYALLNVIGFRRINWRFDIIGGLGYFMLVFSMFPRCSVGAIYASPTWSESIYRFIDELLTMQYEMLTSSYVSLITAVGMSIMIAAFADTTSTVKRCITAIVVSLSHCIAAFSILVLFECIIDIATERGSLGRQGNHSLYEFFSASLPSPVTSVDASSTMQLFANFMKLCMTIFDVPEMVAIHRIKICASPSGLADLSRMELWQYYVSLLPYYFVLATPVVGIIFGVYLYVSVNVFGRHYNEAFSALRIASYKNFVRLHFQPNGDLELFVFGVDKMPKKWRRDPNWSGSTHARNENHLPSHRWSCPSYWKPVVTKVGNLLRLDFENPELDAHLSADDRSIPHLIDRVVIRRDDLTMADF
ncbi:hypothetical protein PINS_up002366 [Pythium insidiosum]|nr:hypothetical protein PINS_up002366 [Pythium insidiosum]